MCVLEATADLLREVGYGQLTIEAVAARQDQGVTVEWVRATEAARGIPLGSLAHLLGRGDEAHHQDDLLHLARSLGTTPSALREDYRRVIRRSRRVVERLFYGAG